MKKQISVFLAALCLFSANSPAIAAPDNHAAWLFNCEANSCLMGHTIETAEAGTPVKVVIIMEFDKAKALPNWLFFSVPPDADLSAGVHVGFTDFPATKEPEYFTVPFGKCDEKGCATSIQQGPGKSDIQKLFVEKFAAHAYLEVIYEKNGDYPRIGEKTAMFLRDYQSLLAEMKKPQ